MTDTPIRLAAAAAHAAGIACLPVKEDGSKAPDVGAWRPYIDHLPGLEELGQWFPADTPRTGFGLIMGSVSGGLECLDFDDEAAFLEFDRLTVDVGLSELWTRVVAGYLEETPNGDHVVYRVAGAVHGNLKLAATADKKTTIETRGEGGYIVAAPSHGTVHASGEPYTLISGGLDQIATITLEERELLHGLARSMDQTPEPVAAPSVPGLPAKSDAPGSLYNVDDSLTTTQLMLDAGWVLVASRGGTDYLRRPGKDVGISATVGHIAPGILRVFTTSTDFEAKSYDKFGAFAVLYHGGDHSEAGRALYRDFEQYRKQADPMIASPELAPRVERVDHNAPGPGLDTVTPGDAGGGVPEREKSRLAPPPAAPPYEDEIEGFDQVVQKHMRDGIAARLEEVTNAPASVTPGTDTREAGVGVQPSPTDIPRDPNYCFRTPFPPDHMVARYIAMAARQTDAPHDYHEALALVALATVAGPNVRAPLEPWEPRGLASNLYILLGGPSTTSRKSTVVRIAKQIINEAAPLALMPAEWSPEAFQEELADRDGKPALWAPDEFQATLEAFSGKSHMAGARGMMLTLYDGEAFTRARTRKRGGRGAAEGDDTTPGAKQNDSVIITNPHLNVIGAATPTIYDKLSSADVEDGLLPRFAIILPESAPPYRRIGVSREVDLSRRELVDDFKAIRQWAEYRGINARTEWTPAAIEEMNDGMEALDGNGGGAAVGRLATMLIKVSILSALGRERPEGQLTVTDWDVQMARAITARWAEHGRRFTSQIGGLTEYGRRHEQSINRVIEVLKKNGGEAGQRALSRAVRGLTSTDWDEITRSMQMSEHVKITTEQTAGRPKKTWTLL